MNDSTARRNATLVLCAALGVVVLAGLAVGSATGATAVNSCTTIDSGGAYELTGDIQDSSLDACIEITASNVTFDGQNHTIDGDGSNGDGAVEIDNSTADLSNVTVRNLTITDWRSALDGEAVFIDEVVNSTITGLNASGVQDGVDISTSVSNENVTVANSTIDANRVGVQAFGGSHVVVDNRISAAAEGVNFGSGNSGQEIRRNTIQGGFDAGISVNGPNSVVANNTVTSAEDGIDVEFGAVLVTGNEVNQSTRGIVVDNGANGSRLFRNTVSANTGVGINVSDSTDAIKNVTLRNNTVLDNGIDFETRATGAVTAENLDIGASTAPNTTLDFEANHVRLNGTDTAPPNPTDKANVSRYVNATDTPNTSNPFLNLTFEYDDADANGVVESTLSVWKNNGSWTELGVDSLDTAANDVGYNITEFDSVFAPLGVSELDNIDSCRTINATNAPSDGLVNLTSDITDSSLDSCINITTGGITLDGQNHTVDSDGTGGVGINASDTSTLSNVDVQNVTVTDWSGTGGLVFDGVANGSVFDVNASNNSEGMVVDSSVGNSIFANEVVSNDGNGVFVDGGGFNGVFGNDVRANGRRGMVVRSSNNNSLGSNVIVDSGFEGVLLSLGSTGTSVINNTVRDSGRDGIGLFSSDANVLGENEVTDSTFAGIGIKSSSNNNTVFNDTLRRNTDEFVVDSSAGTTVVGLDIGDSTAPNTTLDFEAENVTLDAINTPPADPDGVQNIGRFVDATNRTDEAFLDVQFNYNESDTNGAVESTLSVWKNNGSWTELGVDSRNGTSNYVGYNITEFNSVFAPLGASRLDNIDSCRTINASNAPSDGLVNLTSDITDSPLDSCINITTGGVTLAGGNHTVDGTPSGTSANGTGVLVTNASTAISNVTVRNVTVTDWDQGIRYDDVNGGEVRDLFARFNAHHLYTTSTVDSLTIADNVANDTVSSNSGLRIGGTDHLITGNLLGNSRRSIRLAARNTIVEQNTVVDEQVFAIEAFDDDNVIRNNTLKPSTLGVRVRNADNVTVRDNEIDGSVYGASTGGVEVVGTLSFAGANDVVDNTIAEVDGDGIRVQGENDNTTLRGNNVTGAGQNGTAIVGAANVSVVGGTINDSTNEGIYVQNAPDASVTDAVIASNGDDGVFAEDAARLEIVNATMLGNAGHGVRLFFGSPRPVVNESVFDSNTRNGLSIFSTNENATVADNYATGNGFGGGDAFGIGSNSTVVNNTAEATGTQDRGFSAVNDNTFVNNTAVGPHNFDAFDVDERNTLINNTATGALRWAFNVGNGTTAENADIGASTAPNTTLDFTASDVAFDESTSPPADPIGESNIGRFVNLTTTTAASPFFNVTFQYNDSDVSGVDETALDIWKHNGSWTELGTGPATDAVANEVQYNVTNVGSTFAPLAPSTEINNVDACRTINASNAPSDGLVNLTSDITDSPLDSCLNVTVDDVTLDGQGHTVDGDSSGGIGINVTNNAGAPPATANVTVRNITVTDWTSTVGPDGGIRYRDAPDGVITDVNATDNRVGIGISGSDRVNVTDSVVRDDGDGSIDIFSSAGVNVTDTRLEGSNGFAALRTDSNSVDTVVRNVTVRNSVRGFLVNDNATLLNVTARGNSLAAFRTVSGSVPTVENLDVGDSIAPNTTVDFEARNVELGGNPSPPSEPASEENVGRFVEATNLSASHFLNITFQYDDSDVSGVDETALDVWKHNGSWTELGAGPATDAAANEVQYNVTNVGSSFAPLAPNPELDNIDSCRTINASNAPSDGLVNLTADITDSPLDSCINITTSGITLDGQGHTVDGDESGGGSVGINVTNASSTLSNVAVRNVTVSGWSEGVRYEDAISGGITGVDATGTLSRGISLVSSDRTTVSATNATGNDNDGIVLSDSVGNTITDTNVSENAGTGIRLESSSDGNSITSNEGDGLGGYGVQVVGSNSNTVTGNELNDTGQIGISLGTNANDNEVSSNDVRNTSWDGIQITGSEGNDVAGNDVVDADEPGIRLETSTNSRVADNNVTRSTDSGIKVDSDSENDTVTGNDVTDAGGVGILLEFASNATASANTVEGAGDDGIQLTNSDDSTADRNNLTNNNGNGVYLRTSSNNNTVTGNTVTENDGAGVRVAASERANVSSNVARGNFNGIELAAGDNNTLLNNTATDNSVEGIKLGGSGGSNDNDFESNIVTENGGQGIALQDSSAGNSFTNDTVRNNTMADIALGDGPANTFTGLDIGASTAPNTTLDGTGQNIELGGADTVPSNPDAENISRYFEATNTSQDAFLDVSLRYTDTDATGVSESALGLQRYNGSEWKDVPGSSVDTGNNTVDANITAFSTFGAFASGGEPALSGLTTPNLLLAGDTEDVSVTVENVGSGPGTFEATVALEAPDGTVFDGFDSVETSELGAGESETVTFPDVTSNLTVVGPYNVTVTVGQVSLTETDAFTLSVDVDGNGNPAADAANGPAAFDGLFDSVSGQSNNDVGIVDVVALFDNFNDPTVQNNPEFFRFNAPNVSNPSSVGIADVVALFDAV